MALELAAQRRGFVLTLGIAADEQFSELLKTIKVLLPLNLTWNKAAKEVSFFFV